jgi:hypothetical protein
MYMINPYIREVYVLEVEISIGRKIGQTSEISEGTMWRMWEDVLSKAT